MLQSLGVSTEAEALYLVLAPLDKATPTELAELNNVTPETAQEGLAELQMLGLARPTGQGEWSPLSLLEAVRALRLQRLAEVDAAASAAESMYNRILAAAHNDAEDDINVLVGADAIIPVQVSICDNAKREICYFDKPPYVDSRHDSTPESLSASAPEWQALERGIVLRCVYHPGFDADRLSELSLFAARGEQSRTAQVPMKLLLVDGEVALIPSMRSYEPGQELRASLVRHPQLVEALVWLFEAVWDQSVPIMTSTYNDPRRQMLVSMLMTGSTDGAIATQLGINVRSVRRWISELMDELGVTTRLQLGAALVRTDALKVRPPSR